MMQLMLYPYAASVRLARRIVFIGLFLALLWPTMSLAHGGGTPRLTNEAVGPYRLYVWSEPEPWRAGEVHLSLAATLPNESPSNEPGAQVEVPVNDAAVQVTFSPVEIALDERGTTELTPITVDATTQELLNDFYYEVNTELPVEGLWQIEVLIDGPAGRGSTSFELEALPPRTINWTLVGAAGGILILLMALMVIWTRKRLPATPAQSQHPASRRRIPAQ